MTNKTRLLIAAVVVVALVGGGILAMSVFGGGGATGASPSPVAVASGSITPAPESTAPSVTVSPIETPSATPGASASAPPEASASVAPSVTPTSAPGEPATIGLTGLKLDAKDDPDGKDRSIAFHADGAGDVTATVSVLSPQGNVVMCLGAGQQVGQPDCSPSATGTLTAVVPAGGGDFVLTLRGEGVEAPVVDVTLTFPATTPAVLIAGARFDGTQYPETNGIAAVVTPRRAGDVTLSADWGGHPFLYTVDLREQGGPGSQVLADQGPATRMAETMPITAPNPWELVLEERRGRVRTDGAGRDDRLALMARPVRPRVTARSTVRSAARRTAC